MGHATFALYKDFKPDHCLWEICKSTDNPPGFVTFGPVLAACLRFPDGMLQEATLVGLLGFLSRASCSRRRSVC